VAALLAAPCTASAQDLFSSARNKLKRGDYAAGIADLEKAGSSSEVLEALARAYIDTGQYESATKTAGLLGKSRKGKGVGQALLGTVELLTGQYKAVIKRLKREVKVRPRNFEARIVLSEAQAATGTPRRKLRYADEIADFWQSGEVTSAHDLALLGRALHLTEYFNNARDIFEEALEEDDRSVEAHIYFATLFLDKENEKDAGALIDAVLKFNPNHPHALTLTAWMDSSSDNDPIKALENAGKALAVNPMYVPALRVRAQVYIETEQFESAQLVLQQALKTNPNDPETLAMIAACRLLLEDDKGFKQWMKRALKVNKRYAEAYHIVAEYAVRQHRYQDGIDLERKAIKLDPEYWPSYVGLGIGYSRVGKDALADKYLQLAFENDSMNVRAFNMTDGFYDGPAKQMSWHKMGAFRVRLNKSESDVLTKVLPATLKAAYATHKEHYHFTPKPPLHLEFFKSRTTFGVRSIGYPGIGAHGICFGHVVTSVSPSAGDFNWAMVIWHELAHVWHIQLSRSRVPRWFTEGLAEHETTLRRPEWKREMNEELWAAHKAGKLKGIDSFNTMFTGARSMAEIVLAYYYASKVVAFIDKTWGFEVFPKMLRIWGKRKSTAVVFKEVLGLELAEFDKRMKAYLNDDLLVAFRDEFTPAEKKEGADEASLAYHVAVEALKNKEWLPAAQQLDEVLGAGKDGPALRVLRARAAIGAEDWAGARTHLEAALKLDPQRAAAYSLLRKVLEKLKDEDGLYSLMKAASAQEEHTLRLILDILEKAVERGAKDDLRLYSERAMHIGPFNPLVRTFRGESLLADGKPKLALAEAEIALSLPDGPALKRARELKQKATDALK